MDKAHSEPSRPERTRPEPTRTEVDAPEAEERELTAPDAPHPRETSGRSRLPRRFIVGITLLTLGVLGAVVAAAILFVKFNEASALIEQQNREIEEQERELEEQRELIEKKQTFGLAMEGLLTTASAFEGTLMASLVPDQRFAAIAQRAWVHRWDAGALDLDIASADSAQYDLEVLLTDASAQLSANATGSTYEAVIDQLGAGFVTSAIDDADSLCGADVLACVVSNDPFTVHFDASSNSLPYMTDWLRTGLAYHEFAHVLQMTNPKPTETAVASFSGDHETMADCFALTYLDGWTLDHEIWINEFEYWEASIGYGYTCNEEQAQVIRDWYGQLGYTPAPISQF